MSYAKYTGIPGSGSGGGGGNINDVNAQTGPSITIAAGPGIGVVAGSNIITISNTGSTPTGTPNTFAGFDGVGALESLPNWLVNTDTTGASFSVNYAPVDANTTTAINSFTSSISPAASLPNLFLQGLNNFHSLNSPNDFVSFVGFTNGVTTSDLGNKGNITGISQQISLGDGTNASSSENVTLFNATYDINDQHTLNQSAILFNTDINIHAAAIVNSVGGENMFINVDGQVGTNIYLYNTGVNVNASQSSNVGVNGLGINNQVFGDLQFMNGVFINPQLRTGANLVNGINAFSDALHQETGTTSHGVTSFGAFANFDAGSTLAGGYSGMGIGPNINGDMSTSGFNGVSLSANISSPMNFFTGFSNFSQLNSGASINGGLQGFVEQAHMNSGTSAAGITNYGAYSLLDTGATINYFQGLNVSPTFNGTITGGINLAQLNGNGSSVIPNVTGLSINLNQLNSPNQKQGLNINDGTLNVNSNYDTSVYPASPGFINLNGLGGLFEIAVGNPMSNTLVLANNIGVSTLFRDDMGPDPFVGTLGFANLACVSQGSVAIGKTVSAYNQELLATSVPDLSTEFPGYVDGGTITNYFALRMPGILPQGGNLIVTNQYQIYMDSIGGASLATNAWGLYIADPAYQNYIKSSIAIDTTTFKVSNASVGLEIGGTTKALRLSNLTTTERNALTPLAGMEIFNTTSSQAEFYDGATWVSSSGSGVTSLNSLTGALNIVAGSGITVTPAGSNITIAATGSSGSSVTRSLLNNTGSTIPAGAAVCLSTTTSGEIRLADPNPSPVDASASARVIGVAAAAIPNTTSGDVVIGGVALGVLTGLTQGSYAYLDDVSPGVLVDVAPTTPGVEVIKVGAIDSNDLYIQIENIGVN